MWYADLETKTRLGALLVKRRLITAEQLKHAIAQQRLEGGISLGDLLVRENLVTRAQLRRCLRRQTRLRCTAALLALLCAPLQGVWAGGGMGSGGSMAEQAAYEKAESYADCPQLDLHDLEQRDEVDEVSGYRAARILSEMLLRSMWRANAESGDAETGRSKRVGAPKWSLRMSSNKVVMRVDYRF